VNRAECPISKLFQPRVSMAIGLAKTSIEKSDAEALEGVQKGDREQVKSWLQKYNVFQGRTNSIRLKVTQAVIDFDVSKIEGDRILSARDAASHVNRLEEVCKLIENRSWRSLCTKSLWLKRPNSFIIYDSFAATALNVLTKLDASFQSNSTGLERYFESWLHFYEYFEALTEELSLERSDYRLRDFDKFLWLLGDPKIPRAENSVSE